MTVYLDNAATSHPKPESVYRAVDEYMRETGANPGRGAHRLALGAARMVYDVRESLADFFGVSDPARIVFTANATESINLGLFGLLQPGDRVVTTSMEHNAVVRPLWQLQQKGVEVVKIQADSEGYLDPGTLFRVCREKPTRMVVMSHCSNVCGTVQSIDRIGPWCRDNDVVFMVDAAQTAGLLDIDVEKMSIDLLAAPGHKSLLGPPGTGFLYIHPRLQLKPLLFGGTGGNSTSSEPSSSLPERFEAGTLNTSGIAGLGAALEFIRRETMQRIREHEGSLVARFTEQIAPARNIRTLLPVKAEHLGPVSFVVAAKDSAAVGFDLDNSGLCLRSGLHCAPDAHRTLGTFPSGTVRASFGYFNTLDDVNALVKALIDQSQ